MLLLCMFAVPVFAEGSGFDVSAVEEKLPDDAREVGGTLTTDGSYDVRGAIARLYGKAKSILKERLNRELSELARIVAIAVVCAVSETVCADVRMRQIMSLCACAAVTRAAAGPLDSIAGELTEAIRALCDYGRAALPAVYTASALSGAVVSAGVGWLCPPQAHRAKTRMPAKRIAVSFFMLFCLLCKGQ